MAAKLLDAVQRYRKIEEVTSAKDDAPPVYLMDEIFDLAKTSADNAQSIADHIKKRLENRSPVTKYKALRLTRHIIAKGCSPFQRSMQKYSSSIKELVTFRGEPDPFKGDIPNQRVRDAAKETLEILFSSMQIVQPSVSTNVGGRIQGFGNNNYSSTDFRGTSSIGSMGNSSSGMIGFGSSDLRGSNVPESNSYSAAGSYSSNPYSVASREPIPTATYNGTRVTYSYAAPEPTAASSEISMEERLVDDVCAAGGMRVAPDPDELRRFVEGISMLDGLKVAELLQQRMASTSWQCVLRALAALEAVITTGSAVSAGEVAVMFQSDPSPIRRALDSPQASVRERASKVLKLLLNEGSGNSEFLSTAASSAISATPHAQPKASSPLDLLGDLNVPPQAHQPTANRSDFLSGIAGPAQPHFNPNPNPAPTFQHQTMGIPQAPKPAAVDPFLIAPQVTPSTNFSSPAVNQHRNLLDSPVSNSNPGFYTPSTQHADPFAPSTAQFAPSTGLGLHPTSPMNQPGGPMPQGNRAMDPPTSAGPTRGGQDARSEPLDDIFSSIGMESRSAVIQSNQVSMPAPAAVQGQAGPNMPTWSGPYRVPGPAMPPGAAPPQPWLVELPASVDPVTNVPLPAAVRGYNPNIHPRPQSNPTPAQPISSTMQGLSLNQSSQGGAGVQGLSISQPLVMNQPPQNSAAAVQALPYTQGAPSLMGQMQGLTLGQSNPAQMTNTSSPGNQYSQPPTAFPTQMTNTMSNMPGNQYNQPPPAFPVQNQQYQQPTQAGTYPTQGISPTPQSQPMMHGGPNMGSQQSFQSGNYSAQGLAQPSMGMPQGQQGSQASSTAMQGGADMFNLMDLNTSSLPQQYPQSSQRITGDQFVQPVPMNTSTPSYMQATAVQPNNMGGYGPQGGLMNQPPLHQGTQQQAMYSSNMQDSWQVPAPQQQQQQQHQQQQQQHSWNNPAPTPVDAAFDFLSDALK